MVQNIAKRKEKIVKIISTIDFVKNLAMAAGWDGTKSKKNRKFLSDLKDLLTEWQDVPYQEIKRQIKILEEEKTDLIFIDCREPEEIKRFVEDYNAMTLLVQRGELPIMGNHADDNVLNYQYDITIDNSRGLDELRQEAEIFAETFLEENDGSN